MLLEFLEEYSDWKYDLGDPVEFTDDGSGVYWAVIGETLQRVNVSIFDLDDAVDREAIVVESPIGPLTPEVDLRSLLNFAASRMVVSRFSLCPRGEEQILVVESASPVQSLSLPMFDRMLREVMSIAVYFLQKPDRLRGYL